MKPPLLTSAAMLLSLCTPAALAQEPATAPPPAKCEMCEMMKKKAPALPPMNEQIAELDKLVAEMNGSIGPRKIEAMAAVVTRLVEQYKRQAGTKPAPAPAPATAPTPPSAPAAKEEAHQH